MTPIWVTIPVPFVWSEFTYVFLTINWARSNLPRSPGTLAVPVVTDCTGCPAGHDCGRHDGPDEWTLPDRLKVLKVHH